MPTTQSDWTIGYPIAFTPQGDLTMEAMYKHIQEVSKIYGHLNYLRANTEGGASLAIGGFAPTPDELPTSGIPVNTVYLTNGDSYDLWVWNGEQWNRLNLNTLPIATTETAGVVQLGTLAGVNSDVPSPNKAITEEVLSRYRQSGDAGVPSGTIIQWWGSNQAIPAGWAYCDGTSGTPDLRDRFIKCTPNVDKDGGDTGGNSTNALTVDNLPGHSHAVDIASTATVSTNHHSHTFSANVSGGGGSVSGYTGSGSSHRHASSSPSSYWGVVSNGAMRSVLVSTVGQIGTQASVLVTDNLFSASNGTGDESSHTHSFSGSGGGGGSVSGSTNSTGGFTVNAPVAVKGNTGNTGKFIALENKPPFFELIFLMKL